MIDIHSHLLYGIDDGSKSLEDSVRIISDLSKIGYTDIILTPHYISNTKYNSSKNNNLKLFDNLKVALRENGIKKLGWFRNSRFLSLNSKPTFLSVIIDIIISYFSVKHRLCYAGNVLCQSDTLNMV